MEALNSKPSHNRNKENKILVLTNVDCDGAGGRYTRPGGALVPCPLRRPKAWSVQAMAVGRAHVQQHGNLRLCEIPHLPAVLSSNPCRGRTAHRKVLSRRRPRCTRAYTRRSSASGSKGPRYTHGGLARAAARPGARASGLEFPPEEAELVPIALLSRPPVLVGEEEGCDGGAKTGYELAEAGGCVR
jgi:hypothetical protein